MRAKVLDIVTVVVFTVFGAAFLDVFLFGPFGARSPSGDLCLPRRRERYSAVSDGVDGFLGRKSDTANESSGHEAGVTRELSSRENRTR